MARGVRSKKAGRADKAIGLLLAGVGIVLIAGLAAVAWTVAHKAPLDPETNCPREGPSAVHMILIDQSDPITGLQAQRIRQEMTRLKTGAKPGTRFDIYTFQGDTSAELRPVLSVCAPKHDANELIENPERVRKRYEERFSAVLDKTVDELLGVSERPSSPIVESLRAAAQTSFGLLDAGQVPLRVMLVSDMVQNTADVSHFRSEPSFDQLARNAKWPTLRPVLKGAEVQVLYLLRPSALRGGKPIQNAGHQLFWERLIAASGGRLTSIEPF
jgi:hypothetical protein